MARLDDNAASAREQADATIDEAIELLERRREAIHAAVDDIRHAKHRALLEHKESIESAERHISSSRAYAQKLLSGGCSLSGLLELKRHVMGGMRETQRAAPTLLHVEVLSPQPSTLHP